MGGTALSGALRRGPDGRWYWADGTLEPRVTDLRMADWFRFPTREEDGVVYVEVPVSQARADTQLKWVRFGHYRTDLSSTLPPSVPERSPHDKRLFAFEELDLDILLEIISRMSSIRSAPILARMSADRAQVVTEELARRMRERPDFLEETAAQ